MTLAWWRRPEFGFALLWITGPAAFAMAGLVYRYGTETPLQVACLVTGIVLQPPWLLLWVLLNLAAATRLFRRLDWWLLCLHPALLGVLFLPALLQPGQPPPWFGGLLRGSWALGGFALLRSLWLSGRLRRSAPAG